MSSAKARRSDVNAFTSLVISSVVIFSPPFSQMTVKGFTPCSTPAMLKNSDALPTLILHHGRDFQYKKTAHVVK